MAGKVTATVSNAQPHQNSRVTVTGHVGGQNVSHHDRMITTWHFKTRNVQCQADADANGTAQCTRDIGRATRGFVVVIDVVFINLDTGQSPGATQVSFTPT